jgi:hypothetical protein
VGNLAAPSSIARDEIRRSLDIDYLSGLRTGTYTCKIGILRRFNFGFPLDTALFLLLLLLFARTFSNSFFQSSSLLAI